MRPLEYLGSALRSLRVSRGLTQLQLAQKSGLTPSRLSRFERDLQKPSLEVLERLLVALESDLGDLYTEQHGEREEQGGLWPPDLPNRELLLTLRRHLWHLENKVTMLQEILANHVFAAFCSEQPGDSRPAEGHPTAAEVRQDLAEIEEHLNRFSHLWTIEPTPSSPEDLGGWFGEGSTHSLMGEDQALQLDEMISDNEEGFFRALQDVARKPPDPDSHYAPMLSSPEGDQEP